MTQATTNRENEQRPYFPRRIVHVSSMHFGTYGTRFPSPNMLMQTYLLRLLKLASMML